MLNSILTYTTLLLDNHNLFIPCVERFFSFLAFFRIGSVMDGDDVTLTNEKMKTSHVLNQCYTCTKVKVE